MFGTMLSSLLAKVLAATVAITVVGAGVAIAADGAAPGDALYGIDRALENVGIGAGGITERFDEVARLIDTNRVADALNHASEVLADLPQELEIAQSEIEDASDALGEAAKQISEVRSDKEAYTDTQVFRDHAAELVQFLSEQLADDQEGVDGEAVAERARAFADAARAFADKVREELAPITPPVTTPTTP